MKITKVKTKLGEPLSPVSTDLEGIIERMRSETIKAAADKIARNAMASRLVMERVLRATISWAPMLCLTSSSAPHSDAEDSMTSGR